MKSGKNIDPIKLLTPRESEVFYLLLEGMKAKEIAAKMSISPSGVNYFVKRIYKKLQVESKVDLILKYFALRPPQA